MKLKHIFPLVLILKLRAFVDYTEIGETSVLAGIISNSKAYLKQIENE